MRILDINFEKGEKLKIMDYVLILLISSQAFTGVDLFLRRKFGGIPLSYANIAIVLFVAAVILALMGGRVWKLGLTEILVLILVLEMTFQGLYVVDFREYLEYYISIMRGVIVFLLISLAIRREKHIKSIFIGMYGLLIINIFGGIVQELAYLYGGRLIFGLAQYSHIKVYFLGRTFVRVSGFINDPNVFAAYVLVSFAFIVEYMKPARKRLFILSIFVFITIIITFSRGALVAFVLWAMWYFYRFMKKHNKILFGIYALIAAFSIRWVVTSGARSIKDGSSMERLSVIFEMIKITGENILTGVGIGNLAVVSEHNITAHNLVLEVSASMGMLGLIIFAWVVWLCIKRGRKNIKNHRENVARFGRSTLSAVVAYLVVSIFLSTFSNTLLWIILGITCRKFPREEG